MVGLMPLKHAILVRIQVPEHRYKNEQKCPFLLCKTDSNSFTIF